VKNVHVCHARVKYMCKHHVVVVGFMQNQGFPSPSWSPHASSKTAILPCGSFWLDDHGWQITTSVNLLEILSQLMTFYNQVITILMAHQSQGWSWWQLWRPVDYIDSNGEDLLMTLTTAGETRWQPVMMTLTTIVRSMTCDHTDICSRSVNIDIDT